MPERDRLKLAVFGGILKEDLKANCSATVSSLEFAEIKRAPPSVSFFAFSDKGAVCNLNQVMQNMKEKIVTSVQWFNICP